MVRQRENYDYDRFKVSQLYSQVNDLKTLRGTRKDFSFQTYFIENTSYRKKP